MSVERYEKDQRERYVAMVRSLPDPCACGCGEGYHEGRNLEGPRRCVSGAGCDCTGFTPAT